jgi:Rrf2 family protein
MLAVLSRSSEYAIRALTWLAQQPGEQFHLARDMAVVLDIPAPFLGKVLQPLVARGVLHSQRGRSGGFRLARPTREISLQEIVLTQEKLERMRQCILGQRACQEHDSCPLHDWWSRASAQFFSVLERTSLEDLARYAQQHAGCCYPLPLDLSVSGAPLPSLGTRPAQASPRLALNN